MIVYELLTDRMSGCVVACILTKSLLSARVCVCVVSFLPQKFSDQWRSQKFSMEGVRVEA